MAFKVKLPRRPQNRSRATTRTIRKLFIFRKYGRVGKTRHSMRRRDIKRKHPHRRGEDIPPAQGFQPLKETPPQAWGRHDSVMDSHLEHRNTPTGVGKTFAVRCVRQIQQKHPHRRGEDLGGSMKERPILETPPQAWGRRIQQARQEAQDRNTPTGVGKTGSASAGRKQLWKHPHRRGEDFAPALSNIKSIETPPQAWGRQPLRRRKAR